MHLDTIGIAARPGPPVGSPLVYDEETRTVVTEENLASVSGAARARYEEIRRQISSVDTDGISYLDYQASYLFALGNLPFHAAVALLGALVGVVALRGRGAGPPAGDGRASTAEAPSGSGPA